MQGGTKSRGMAAPPCQSRARRNGKEGIAPCRSDEFIMRRARHCRKETQSASLQRMFIAMVKSEKVTSAS